MKYKAFMYNRIMKNFFKENNMQEQLDDLEKEFTPLHNKEIEFNTKHKNRFIWTILSYIGYLILPTFIITFLLIAMGPEDNGVFVTFTPTEKDRKSTRLNSSHVKISYAVFCLKKKI